MCEYLAEGLEGKAKELGELTRRRKSRSIAPFAHCNTTAVLRVRSAQKKHGSQVSIKSQDSVSHPANFLKKV